MIFVLCGNSEQGKTTLASVLNKVFEELHIVYGDDFVTFNDSTNKTEIDWNSLKQAFKTDKHILFEHISSIYLCDTLGLSYDVAFFIGNEEQWNDITKREYNYALENNKKIIKGNNFNELLAKIFVYFNSALKIYPAKITNFVIKIATHCNLSCSYCYMYELACTNSLKNFRHFLG